jgi:hypothetical protein
MGGGQSASDVSLSFSHDPLDDAKSLTYWKLILSQGDLPDRSSLTPYTLAGIPSSLRAAIWRTFALSGLDTPVPDSQAPIAPVHPAVSLQIDRDCPRTFPGTVARVADARLGSLRRVLLLYSSVDPAIGYTQGMNFVASLPVYLMSESDAFATFYGIMRNPNIYLRDFYESGLPGLTKLANIWFEILNSRYPFLRSRIEASENEPLMLCVRTFASLLIALSLPLELKVVVFDRLIIHGKKSLVSFVLAIPRMFGRELQSVSAEDFVPMFMEIDKSDVFQDVAFVIESWNQEWVSDEEYGRAVAAVEQRLL